MELNCLRLASGLCMRMCTHPRSISEKASTSRNSSPASTGRPELPHPHLVVRAGIAAPPPRLPDSPRAAPASPHGRPPAAAAP
eukprot:scaffold2549_cov57-Phaeocystis_antarctica.AAC.3